MLQALHQRRNEVPVEIIEQIDERENAEGDAAELIHALGVPIAAVCRGFAMPAAILTMPVANRL
jgi:hypothetical protein